MCLHIYYISIRRFLKEEIVDFEHIFIIVLWLTKILQWTIVLEKTKHPEIYSINLVIQPNLSTYVLKTLKCTIHSIQILVPSYIKVFYFTVCFVWICIYVYVCQVITWIYVDSWEEGLFFLVYIRIRFQWFENVYETDFYVILS